MPQSTPIRHKRNSLGAAVQFAVEGYLTGAQQPIRVNPALLSDNFNVQLYGILEKHLPFSEQLLVRQCLAIRDQGLRAAQSRNLEEAERFFQAANSLLQGRKFSQEGSLLSQTYYEAGAAYLDYSRGDFDGATVRVFEALKCDCQLEQEYGYNILHLHRIQLLHNLMRVTRRRENVKEALEIGYQLLDYMEQKTSTLTIAPEMPWDSTCLSTLPSDLVAGMFVQVTTEIAFILGGKAELSTPDMFSGARTHTSAKHSATCNLSAQAHAWLQVKQDLVDGNLAAFFRKAGTFLSQGRDDTFLLWYGVVADVIAECKLLDTQEAHLIRKQVAKDATVWKTLPQFWRLMLIEAA